MTDETTETTEPAEPFRYEIKRQAELKLCQQAQDQILAYQQEIEKITAALINTLAADAGVAVDPENPPRFDVEGEGPEARIYLVFG